MPTRPPSSLRADRTDTPAPFIQFFKSRRCRLSSATCLDTRLSELHEEIILDGIHADSKATHDRVIR